EEVAARHDAFNPVRSDHAVCLESTAGLHGCRAGSQAGRQEDQDQDVRQAAQRVRRHEDQGSADAEDRRGLRSLRWAEDAEGRPVMSIQKSMPPTHRDVKLAIKHEKQSVKYNAEHERDHRKAKLASKKRLTRLTRVRVRAI